MLYLHIAVGMRRWCMPHNQIILRLVLFDSFERRKHTFKNCQSDTRLPDKNRRQVRSTARAHRHATRENFCDRPSFRLPIARYKRPPRHVQEHPSWIQSTAAIVIQNKKKKKKGKNATRRGATSDLPCFHFSRKPAKCTMPHSRETVRISAEHWTWLRTCRAGEATYFCFSHRLRLFPHNSSVCSITDFCFVRLNFSLFCCLLHTFSVAVATAADTPAWFAWLAGLPHSHTALQSHRNKLIYFRCWCSKCKSSKNYRIYSGKVLRIAKNKKKTCWFFKLQNSNNNGAFQASTFTNANKNIYVYLSLHWKKTNMNWVNLSFAARFRNLLFADSVGIPIDGQFYNWRRDKAIGKQRKLNIQICE